MLGAIIGDFIGSPYEFNNIKTTEFPLFSKKSFYTDDTILTIAVCDAILKDLSFEDSLVWWANRYPSPYGDYGGSFRRWVEADDHSPYGSFGNGSAMRVSSVGWLYDTAEQVTRIAEQSASITHNHPEGIKGAIAVALAIFMARTGESKDIIKKKIEGAFEYDLSRTTTQIRKTYSFDDSCQGSVPEAFICFLESQNYESAVRLAVSIGGDSDTIACIAGAVAEAYYGHIPAWIVRHVIRKLPYDMWLVLYEFLQGTKAKNQCRPYFFFRWEDLRRKVLAWI